MRKLICIVTGILMLLVFASCTTPEEKSLRSLQELYQDLEQNHENYTLEDWDKAQAEYDAITAGMNLKNYTNEQLREIGKLKGKCSAYLTKGLLKRAEKGFVEFGGMLEGYLEGLESIKPDSLK